MGAEVAKRTRLPEGDDKMTTCFTFTAQHPGLFDLSLLTVPVNPKVTLLDSELEDHIRADNDAAYWYLLDNLHGMGVDYDLTDDNIFSIKCDDTPRVLLYCYRGGVDIFTDDQPFKWQDWVGFEESE